MHENGNFAPETSMDENDMHEYWEQDFHFHVDLISMKSISAIRNELSIDYISSWTMILILFLRREFFIPATDRLVNMIMVVIVNFCPISCLFSSLFTLLVSYTFVTCLWYIFF